MISEQTQKKLLHLFLPDTNHQEKKPLLYAMAGIPAAGKTTFLEQRKSDLPANHYYHNPDVIMEALPEYQADYIALGPVMAKQNWETVARSFADEILFTESLKRRQNIVMDMGLCREEILKMVQNCRLAGYQIHLNIIHCDLHIAIQRSQSRHRHVAESVIIERAEFLADNIERIITLADQTVAMDNSCLGRPFTAVSLHEIVEKITQKLS